MFRIYWDREDVKSVTTAIESGMMWAVGPNIEKFDKMLANYIGTKYCVVFNSGTSALHAVLLAYGIGNGDEIIVPSFTFIATANAPLFVGAQPVFADIEEETFGLDPRDVERKISSRTKAIIAIHYGGCPCQILELKEVAEEHNLLLIEDAAESFGAKIGDRKVGTFGNASMLSFCQNKIITTGDGGAIVTNSNPIYEKLKLIRSHGRLETSDYFRSAGSEDYITLGYNFRMSNIVSALGISQLEKADKVIEMRRKNAAYLTSRLRKEVEDVVLQSTPYSYYHVYQMYTVRVKERNRLKGYLADKGIMTKVYFRPVHQTHFYKNVLKYMDKLPITERIANQVLSLPMYPNLEREDMDIIVEMIKVFYKEN